MDSQLLEVGQSPDTVRDTLQEVVAQPPAPSEQPAAPAPDKRCATASRTTGTLQKYQKLFHIDAVVQGLATAAVAHCRSTESCTAAAVHCAPAIAAASPGG